MAISRITSQDASAAASSTTLTATYPATPTQGDLLIAAFAAGGLEGTITVPSGWTKDVSNSGNAHCVMVCSRIAGAAEPTGVTFLSSASVVLELGIYEYQGNDAAPIDQTGTGTNDTNVTTLQIGPTPATTVADELLVAATRHKGNHSAFAWTDSFQARHDQNRSHVGDRIVAATGAYQTTPTWTTAVQVRGVMATYKAAAGGGAPAWPPPLIVAQPSFF